jgi:hypothetical protein
MSKLSKEAQDYRLIIKNKLMSKLYKAQLDYWNKRLIKLSRTNAMCFGRQQNLKYAIYFNRRQWRPEHLDWADNDTDAYCLPLHSSFPDMTEEMAIIADEMSQLEHEKYETDRFLSGLVLFKAPPHIFHKVLGDTLYRPIQPEIEKFCSHFSNKEWDRNGEFSMNIFIEKNQGIIKAMKERILVNLVTLEP